jgi:hypothetical protein
MLNTEELNTQLLDLSKQVTDMTTKSCAIQFLKELCDALYYEISYRLHHGYCWCFFRVNMHSPIMFTKRVSWGLEDAKRQVSHLMLECLIDDGWVLHTEYQPEKYNPSLILLLKEYTREYSKRLPLHPTQTVQEIAIKKGYKISWEFAEDFNRGRYVCICVAKNVSRRRRGPQILRSKPVSVDFCEGAKNEAKRLASLNLINLFSSH